MSEASHTTAAIYLYGGGCPNVYELPVRAPVKRE